jgi:hypothetical protein
MKKLAIYSGVIAMLTLSSCAEKVCIKCTPIPGQAGEDQTLCSRNADERKLFQTDWIYKGYNCATTEETSAE